MEKKDINTKYSGILKNNSADGTFTIKMKEEYFYPFKKKAKVITEPIKTADGYSYIIEKIK